MFRLWKLSAAIFVLQAIAFLSGLAEGSWLLGMILAFMVPSVLCVAFRDNEMFDLYDVCRSAVTAVVGVLVIYGLGQLPVEALPFSVALGIIAAISFLYGVWYFARGAAVACQTPIKTDYLGIGSFVAMPLGIGTVIGVVLYLTYVGASMTPSDDAF